MANLVFVYFKLLTNLRAAVRLEVPITNQLSAAGRVLGFARAMWLLATSTVATCSRRLRGRRWNHRSQMIGSVAKLRRACQSETVWRNSNLMFLSIFRMS